MLTDNISSSSSSNCSSSSSSSSSNNNNNREQQQQQQQQWWLPGNKLNNTRFSQLKHNWLWGRIQTVDQIQPAPHLQLLYQIRISTVSNIFLPFWASCIRIKTIGQHFKFGEKDILHEVQPEINGKIVWNHSFSKQFFLVLPRV